MFCPHCGKENEEKNKFCVYCGLSLSEETQAPKVTEKIRAPKGKKVFLLCLIALIICGAGITLYKLKNPSLQKKILGKWINWEDLVTLQLLKNGTVTMVNPWGKKEMANYRCPDKNHIVINNVIISMIMVQDYSNYLDSLEDYHYVFDPRKDDEYEIRISGDNLEFLKNDKIIATIRRAKKGDEEKLISEQNKLRCCSNLKQIGLALHMWAQDHNENFPEALKDLYPEYICDGNIFRCPGDKRHKEVIKELKKDTLVSYDYVKGLTEEYPTDIIIAHDALKENHGDGRNVLFLDGQAKYLPEKEFQVALSSSKKSMEVLPSKTSKQQHVIQKPFSIQKSPEDRIEIDRKEPVINITGTWQGTYEVFPDTVNFEMQFSQTGETITGTFSEENPRPQSLAPSVLKGTVKGNINGRKIAFEKHYTNINWDPVTYTGTLNKDGTKAEGLGWGFIWSMRKR